MTAVDELKAFLVHYHENATRSCWLRVYDHPNDSPDNERFKDTIACLDTKTRLALKKEQDQLKSFNNLLLRRHMGLDEDTYINMMVRCGWFQKRKTAIRMQADNIKNLFITLKIEAESESAHPKGSGGRRLWIRLGPKQKGYHNSVASQVHAQDFMPPRNGSLATGSIGGVNHALVDC